MVICGQNLMLNDVNIGLMVFLGNKVEHVHVEQNILYQSLF